jgi:hypothetical protein
MNAATIAKALGGLRVGAGWMAKCPVHDDHTPSLAIRDGTDGRVLVRCHADCPQEQVIARLRALGLWHGSRSGRRLPISFDVSATPASTQRADRRADIALALWREARSADGTLVVTYLASRSLRLPFFPALRFHAALKHPSGRRWPAMVALVTNGADEIPLGIHRTFLARDGSDKAPVEPQRMLLGSCRGGAVKLAETDNTLMIGEGIETCLAAMQATGRPAWAAISTSGMRALELPTAVREVIVLADGDEPGEAAAIACARRWKREGRCVCIARPSHGSDFNDVLLAGRTDNRGQS